MLLFADSFGAYDQAQMGDMWDIVSTPYGVGPAPSSIPVTLTQARTGGRFDEGGVTFAAPDLSSIDSVAEAPDPQFIQKNYDGVSVVYGSLAVQQTGQQISGTNAGVPSSVQIPLKGGRLATFMDGATVQVGIDIMPSGQLRAIRSTAPDTGLYLVEIGTNPNAGLPTLTELGVSDSAISSNAFEFLQFKITHGETGSIEVRRGDGSVFWLLEGVNTAISGSDRSASMLIGGYGAPYTSNKGTLQPHYLRAIVSDVNILNETVNGDDALDPVTFIGDRHWQVLTPSSDGFYTDWTPSTGSNHAALVNTIPPNTATFNSTSTGGDRDSFLMTGASGPSTASVILAYTPYLQKNTGGDVPVNGFFRLSGSDRSGTEFQAPSPWAYKQSFLASKPGGGAITVADVNSGEHGYVKG